MAETAGYCLCKSGSTVPCFVLNSGEDEAGLEVVVVLAFQFEATVIGLDDILDNREAEAGAVHVFVQPVTP